MAKATQRVSTQDETWVSILHRQVTVVKVKRQAGAALGGALMLWKEGEK